MKYSFSILLIALALPLCAQDRLPDDTTKHRFLPTNIRIGTDLISIGKSVYTDYWKGWEINVDADVYRRFYVAVDYGSWKTNYALENGVYVSDGRYFRVGADVNFLLKDPDRNMFFVGFRRGHTAYRDYTDYLIDDPVLGNISYHAENTNPRANWNELTLGLRIKVWKFIWLGTTGRLKFGYSGKNQWDLLSYDVPGYGKTFKTNWWGINYQVFVKIPVREDPRPRLIP